jgi:hypothetical protein
MSIYYDADPANNQYNKIITSNSSFYHLLQNFEDQSNSLQKTNNNLFKQISEIVVLKNDLIVARTEHGVCFVYN